MREGLARALRHGVAGPTRGGMHSGDLHAIALDPALEGRG
jgi:hypothetical protein